MKDINAIAGMISKLQRAAAAGDPRARAELAKLNAAFASAQILGADDEGSEPDTIEGVEEGAGDEAEMYIQGDQLEQADRLLSGPLRHVDSLTQKAMLLRHRDGVLNQIAPPSNMNPPSAQGAILGNQVVPDSRQKPYEVARWVGSDAEATNFTVTAAPVAPPQAGAPNTAISNNTFLIIQWGVRNNPYNVEVDIGRGVELTLTGSNCTVQVATDPGIAEFVGPPISAGIAFRQGNRTAPLTRTARSYAGGVHSVNIPFFAKRFFAVSNTVANAIDIVLQEPDATIVSSFTIPAGTLPFQVYTIPPGATILDFTCAGICNIIFELNL